MKSSTHVVERIRLNAARSAAKIFTRLSPRRRRPRRTYRSSMRLPRFTARRPAAPRRSCAALTLRRRRRCHRQVADAATRNHIPWTDTYVVAIGFTLGLWAMRAGALCSCLTSSSLITRQTRRRPSTWRTTRHSSARGASCSRSWCASGTFRSFLIGGAKGHPCCSQTAHGACRSCTTRRWPSGPTLRRCTPCGGHAAKARGAVAVRSEVVA